MEENNITEDSEKSEQTVSDEVLICGKTALQRQQEYEKYSALPVREQQLSQLQDFIDCANKMRETDYDTDFSLEYIRMAGAFFSVEVQVMLHGINDHYCDEDESSKQSAIWSLRMLLDLCKLHPELMLSGEHAGGGIIVQEIL
tara:strand:+ start:6839 stop:7267 length:429 start_codon:yes stop_codon:yes gene_type:complete